MITKIEEIVSKNEVVRFSDIKSNGNLYKPLVESLQNRLVSLGLYPLDMVDGLIGPRTMNGVEVFCKSNGLPDYQKGIISPVLVKKLIEKRSASSEVWNFSKSTSDVILKFMDSFIIPHEGGYSNIPEDLGGSTNYGVTQQALDSYCVSKGISTYSVKDLKIDVVHDIYISKYYNSLYPSLLREDSLRCVLFDTSINFGVAGAVMFLQEAMDLPMDGVFDQDVKDELNDHDPYSLAIKIIDNRTLYRYDKVKKNSSQAIFLDGWINRDSDLKKYILSNFKKIQKINNNEEFINQVLALARSKIAKTGTKSLEIWGNNWGPEVKEFLASVGLTEPAPWCAAFVHWCIQKISTKYGLKKKPFPALSYCPAIEDWATSEGILYQIPKIGDAFLLKDSISAFHIGFIVGFNSNGDYITLEGNTSEDGSPEGIGVFQRTRSKDSYMVFVRWAEKVSLDDLYYSVLLNNKEICKAILLNGKSHVPIKDMVTSLGLNLYWDKDSQRFSYLKNSQVVQTVPVMGSILDGKYFVPVRDFVESVKSVVVLDLVFSANGKKILITSK